MQYKTVGKVLELYISTTQTPSRQQKTMLTLNEGGIVGDKFHSKNILRSVLLSSTSSYNIAIDNDIDLTSGALGENILMDCDLNYLNAGDKIRIGSVELEITQNCTICKGLSQINTKLPKLLKDDRGIFSKVVKDGNIRINDNVYIQEIKNK